MRRGDYEAAWRQTDRIEILRRQQEAAGPFQREAHQLIWNGTPFAGRTVLVHCWHGLGDTLQYMRYLPRVRQQARRVIVLAQPVLLSVLEETAGMDELHNGWTNDHDPPHDVAIECMEFAYAFRDTVQTVPASVPYLAADRLRRIATFAPVSRNEFNVGLVWAASSWDATRSIPFRLLAPSANLPGVRLYLFQQGNELSESAGHCPPCFDLSVPTLDIAQSASAMMQMDLVISVDTMSAHLAGALGRPTWTLLRFDADWRWMEGRCDSPWYPTMRLFRQPRPGDWESVAAQVHCALAERAATRTRTSS